MRGLVISAICHVVLVWLAMLSAAKTFDAPAQPIEVDLVSAEEFQQEAKAEPPKPEQQNPWDVPPEKKPLIQLPDFSVRSREQTASPAPAPASGQKSAPTASNQQVATTAPTPAGNQQTAQPPPTPANNQQAAQTPPAQSQPSAQTPASAPAGQARASASATQAPERAASVFDPSNIPMLMNLSNAAGGKDTGFDFEATVTANLSGEERDAFKAHLRKCWKLPDGLVPAPTTKVVLRVYLRRDGALSSEPVLIEASASRDGPAVLLAAKSALHNCQPYAFLPVEKYLEWRVLDLTFTPRDMAGG